MSTLLFSRHRRVVSGFTLLELLLAAGLGVVFCAGLLQLLLGDLRLTASMAQRLQSRRQQQRALALMRAERDLGYGVIANPAPSITWPCSLAGRRPVLAIALSANDPEAREQAIVYSVGAAPSTIWRGHVLMRCGPAYGLDGQMDLGSTAQNRVLLDALPAGQDRGLQVAADHHLPVIDLTLEQQVPARSSVHGAMPALVRSAATL